MHVIANTLLLYKYSNSPSTSCHVSEIFLLLQPLIAGQDLCPSFCTCEIATLAELPINSVLVNAQYKKDQQDEEPLRSYQSRNEVKWFMKRLTLLRSTVTVELQLTVLTGTRPYWDTKYLDSQINMEDSNYFNRKRDIVYSGVPKCSCAHLRLTKKSNSYYSGVNRQ